MDTHSIPGNLQASSHSSGLYFLQVNDFNFGTTESIPLHLMINQLDNKPDQYLVPVIPNKSHDVDFIQNSPKRLQQQIDFCEVTDSLKNGCNTYSQSLIIPPLSQSPIVEKIPLKKTNTTSEKLKSLKNYGVNHRITHTRANELALEAAVSQVPIFLTGKMEESVEHVDVSDKDKSSWLSLLPLGNENTANVWLYEEDNELFGLTVKTIASRTPLLLGYSKKYAEKYQLPPGGPILDLDIEEPEQWWCSECERAMGNASLLQRHLNIYHKSEKASTRRRYRCKHCSHTFSRLFTLKRHSLKFCTKTKEKSNDSIPSNLESNLNFASYTPQNIEENRLPSDESLQNYTNGLDFSTNLFDTDRIASLDTSGSSRSEAEFNPYGLDKDENVTTSDTGYIQFSNNLDDNKFINEKNIMDKTKKRGILVNCHYCDQQIIKAKKRLHFRECPARRFECECGQVFNKKEALATHIHKEHSDVLTKTTIDANPSLGWQLRLRSGCHPRLAGGPPPFPLKGRQHDCDSSDVADVHVRRHTQIQAKTQPSESPYTCEKCKICFKRRGMLVNHLWRIHKAEPASVPLERRVRHYPCVACPKIYSAAAKRDLHVRNHHPGTELIRAAPIEGERRACPPAACPACPRQYATRAKLLQHMRAHHPLLAEPVKAKTSSVKPSKFI